MSPVKKSLSPAVAVVIILVVLVVVALIGWKVMAGKTPPAGDPDSPEDMDAASKAEMQAEMQKQMQEGNQPGDASAGGGAQ